MIPDWIGWSVPFISGVAGIYTGMKVGIARLEVQYTTLDEKVDENRAKLAKQVGDDKCKDLRTNCQTGIEKSLTRLELQVEANKVFVAERIKELVTDVRAIGIAVAKIETKIEASQRREDKQS